jgi:negative regulator of flagellin synthesis FlgM
MPVKVDKPSKSTTSSLTESSPRTPSKRSGNATTPNASSTNVHLGATAAQLRSLESSVASTPVVDASKVAEIKSAISNGRFEVNSGIVADKLIETAQELLRSGAQ